MKYKQTIGKSIMQHLIFKSRKLLAIAIMTATCASVAAEGKIPKQLITTPPTEHSGLAVSGKNALKLGKQIPAFKGYQVRVRTVTMEPGGIVKNHGHKSRPGAFYVVKGQVTEIRGDKREKITSGQAVLESYDTEHWVMNNSGQEAVLFVFDIVPVE